MCPFLHWKMFPCRLISRQTGHSRCFENWLLTSVGELILTMNGAEMPDLDELRYISKITIIGKAKCLIRLMKRIFLQLCLLVPIWFLTVIPQCAMLLKVDILCKASEKARLGPEQLITNKANCWPLTGVVTLS
jgi:hypothetical protein